MFCKLKEEQSSNQKGIICKQTETHKPLSSFTFQRSATIISNEVANGQTCRLTFLLCANFNKVQTTNYQNETKGLQFMEKEKLHSGSNQPDAGQKGRQQSIFSPANKGQL